MRDSDFRVDRIHAALLQRQSELKRQLEMKDTEGSYNFAQGFNYHFQGRERWRMEEEFTFITSLLTILSEPTGVKEPLVTENPIS